MATNRTVRVQKPRLLYYNDARHTYLYVLEPPLSLRDAWLPIDEVAGTQVDVFVYGYGAGACMPFDTKVGEIWFKDQEVWEQVAFWRARESTLGLIRQGLDPLKLLVDRAHHHGMGFYGSLRLSIGAGQTLGWNANNFLASHPEWYVETDLPAGKFGHLDFTFEPVRQERFDLIEESMTRYDVDGFELDFAFSPTFFRPERREAGQEILTEYLREIRRLAQRAGAARGRPITLGARVLPNLAGNLQAGLDVSAWLREGYLDFVVPIFYVNERMDQLLPFEEIAELAHVSGCLVYPAVRPFYKAPPESRSATPAMYRANAMAYYRKGADALYMLQLKWPTGQIGDAERSVLSQVGDPELMERGSRHHFVPSRQEDTAKYGVYTSPLPMDLTVVGDGDGQSCPIYVGDDLAAARNRGALREARLRLRISGASALDQIEVSLNGRLLPTAQRAFQTVAYVHAWIEYQLWDALPRIGSNSVEVAVRSRPRGLAEPLRLHEVELLVEYVGQQDAG